MRPIGFTQIGKFQEFKYPENAEKRTLSTYCEYLDIPSKMVPTVTHQVKEMSCPGCAINTMLEPKHGYAYKCNHCGTHVQTFGNALYMWKPAEWEHPELKPGEVFLLNVKEGEDWGIPPFCESIRLGMVAYSTGGSRVVRDMRPMFGKMSK